MRLSSSLIVARSLRQTPVEFGYPAGGGSRMDDQLSARRPSQLTPFCPFEVFFVGQIIPN